MNFVGVPSFIFYSGFLFGLKFWLVILQRWKYLFLLVNFLFPALSENKDLDTVDIQVFLLMGLVLNSPDVLVSPCFYCCSTKDLVRLDLFFYVWLSKTFNSSDVWISLVILCFYWWILMFINILFLIDGWIVVYFCCSCKKRFDSTNDWCLCMIYWYIGDFSHSCKIKDECTNDCYFHTIDCCIFSFCGACKIKIAVMPIFEHVYRIFCCGQCFMTSITLFEHSFNSWWFWLW